MAQSQHSDQAWHGPLAIAFYRAQEILAQSQRQEANPARESASRPVDPKLTTDEFRMYSFKIDACPHLGEIHDMNECPYLHPGEKARRRDPRVWSYQALPCPDFRKGSCKRGDGCPYGHGVFECWLHPSKYKTTLCKEGAACTRSVCFFAHSLEQLREPTTPMAPSPLNKSSNNPDHQNQPQHLSLPPIVTTRLTTLKAISNSCCSDFHHPNSPGSILHQQGSNSSTSSTATGGGARGFSSSPFSCSSGDTSGCASPTATSAAAAMESLRQASMSLPSSVDSSLASIPLLSEAAAAGPGWCLPASLDIDERLDTDGNNFNFNNDIIENRSGDVAMAAAVALRAQQQQAASAAAAAQAALARILQTAAEHGLTVQSASPPPLPPRYPVTNLTVTAAATAAAAVEKVQGQKQQTGEEFALQQLMTGLGL